MRRPSSPDLSTESVAWSSGCLPKNKSQTAEQQRLRLLNFLLQPPKPTVSHLVCDGNLARKDLENILKKFNRRALLDYRERGVRILYAAFGMLTWREIATNEEVRSPLIMVPVELTRKSVLDPFTLSVPLVEEAAIPNPALQVKLRADFKIDLPSFPENGEARSLTDYFSFVSQTVERFGWKVEPTLEIGLFSFHKLVIFKDLEANADAIVTHPIVRAITGIKDAKLVMDSLPEEKDVDAIETPERTFRVLDADSSQRISIDYALQGQSFVMQGPPGTGKSQTIANIISECIARGKSVLFVSDKMAALEVVYKRLSEVGLAPFCLEMHSSKANKQEVVAELMRCLNEQLVPRNLPSMHDFEKLQALQSSLNGYVHSLHSKQPNLQISAYEVLCELTRLEAVAIRSCRLSKRRRVDASAYAGTGESRRPAQRRLASRRGEGFSVARISWHQLFAGGSLGTHDVPGDLDFAGEPAPLRGNRILRKTRVGSTRNIRPSRLAHRA